MNEKYENRDTAPEEEEAVEGGYEAPEEERVEAPKEAAETRPQNGGVRDDISGASSDDEDWKGKYVRLMADFENYRRNQQIERERLTGLGKESVLEDIFPLLEHMERAIKAAKEVGEGDSGILQGIEMVMKELVTVLAKHGVERVPAVGEEFDPAVHEAVSTMSYPGAEEGTVVEEIRPGFIRNGKLLRPATVVVAA